jgi:GTP-binding protein
MTKIAIIGRPNVGKSTLFNRLAGKRLAIVDDTPGVTRDRRYVDAEWAGLRFTLIDTAGMETAKDDALETRMLAQTKAAIAEADLLLFLIDGRAGVLASDMHFAQMARQSGSPVVLVVNKAEGKAWRESLADAYAMGLGEPIPISAEHGEGMGELFETLQDHCERDAPAVVDRKERKASQRKQKAASEAAAAEAEAAGEAPESGPIQIAILGRPNAGKSTLINALLGEDRLLTGPEAGITRDAISVPFQHQGQSVALVDTAGMRKKANVEEGLEYMAVGDTLRALQYAHIVVVVMDATMPFEKQDNAIAALTEREGRACVIALSKWDLIENREEWLKEARFLAGEHLPQMKDIPIVPIAAVKGAGLTALMDACFEVYEVWNTKIPTAEINRWLEDAEATHTPPLVNGRRLKLKYMTQPKTRPPTFHLFVNIADGFPDAYQRYLVNGLRTKFGLKGVPIRLVLRTGKNPFAKR